MIDQKDAKKVVEVIGNNLIGVSHDSNSFCKITRFIFGGILQEDMIPKEHLESS